MDDDEDGDAVRRMDRGAILFGAFEADLLLGASTEVPAGAAVTFDGST